MTTHLNAWSYQMPGVPDFWCASQSRMISNRSDVTSAVSDLSTKQEHVSVLRRGERAALSTRS